MGDPMFWSHARHLGCWKQVPAVNVAQDSFPPSAQDTVSANVGGLWLRVSRRRARDTPANQGQWWPRDRRSLRGRWNCAEPASSVA